MKILAIRIQNLASLEGYTAIDFTVEPLKSAGIFAITGPTGAGKSTILDALCLALFAKTPRYLQAKEMGIDIQDVGGNTISQGDIRGILRDGTADGFAEVDFRGVDNDTYSASWNIRRARNKADGGLQAYTISLKNISTNTIIPGKKTELLQEIERLVGLNFEQFTRSVLLAQGDFTAFLKAPKDEKSSLLEKLTGTQIYSEISQRVFDSHRNEAQILRDLNLQREGINTLTQEEVEHLSQQKAAIEKNLPQQHEDVAVLIQAHNWHIQYAHLQLQYDSAIVQHQQAEAAKANEEIRIQNFKLVERVQSARSLVEIQQQTQLQITAKTTDLKSIEKVQLVLLQQKKDNEALLLMSDEDVKVKINSWDIAKPMLEKATILDIQIEEKQTYLTDAEAVKLVAAKKKANQEELLKNRQKEANQLLLEMGILKQWKDENENRKAVVENQSLIISKLDDAQQQLNLLDEITLKIESSKTLIENQTTLLGDLNQLNIDICKEMPAVQSQYDHLSTHISTTNIEEVEQEKKLTDTSIEELTSAIYHWEALWKIMTGATVLREKLTSNKSEIKVKDSSIKAIAIELGNLQIQQETSLSILQKARITTAENVENLRNQLVDGDACPVCGSLVHPYSQHHPEFDRLLSQLEDIYKEHALAYKKCLQKQSSEEANFKQLKETILQQEIELKRIEIEIQAQKKGWMQFKIHEICDQVPNEEKQTWLKNKLQEIKAAQKKSQEKIQQYYNEKDNLSKLQQQIINLTAKQHHQLNQIKEAERDLKAEQSQISQSLVLQKKNKEDLSATETLLNPYFTSKDWFVQWKNDPGKFLTQLNTFATKWKMDTEKLTQLTSQHQIVLEKLNDMHLQLVDLEKDFQHKNDKLKDLQKEVADLTQNRTFIFNGEAVPIITARLQALVDEAESKLEQLKMENAKFQNEISRGEAQIDHTRSEMAKLTLKETADTALIRDWLKNETSKNNTSLTETVLIFLLKHTQEWIETESEFLKGLELAITETKSVLKERLVTLERHIKQKVSNVALDALNELLEKAKEMVNVSTEAKTKIQYQLEQDSANKKDISGLLATIKKQALIVENWAKLNEIIGSADGKKFRQIAQEYTLDILLSYANVHLEILSKRYLLQRIPETLGLQVIDQDMGNEIRTVFSLSGGESFLVSLALALGLASLSSSRMQVESLFIDEGFGSLDPTTLNIAMDALERLHNQGRKVGVISHVQEMTERIPVQIKVSKENSGRSKIEII